MCFSDSTNTWELQGILSHHENCGRSRHPSVYTSISSSVQDWIFNTIGGRLASKVKWWWTVIFFWFSIKTSRLRLTSQSSFKNWYELRKPCSFPNVRECCVMCVGHPHRFVFNFEASFLLKNECPFIVNIVYL